MRRFIISWPGWPETGFWSACSLALMDLLRETREEYLQTEERKRSSLQGHREILAAIKMGDGRAAHWPCCRHLEKWKKHI